MAITPSSASVTPCMNGSMGLHVCSCHLKVSFQLGKSSVISDRNLHSRIPWGLDCPALHGGPDLSTLFDLWMVSHWDLHWQKAMYTVPCLIPSTWMMMMTNRILTGYCPLGSGSGPIGALLMGSRMNGYNASVSLILLNSWEWFEAALV